MRLALPFAVASLSVVACGGDDTLGAGGSGSTTSTSTSTTSGVGAGGSGGTDTGGGGAGQGGSGGSVPSGRWTMGYYAGYEAGIYPVDAIEWSALSHLAVAFYLPQADGSLDGSLFMGPSEGAVLGHALVDAAHAHGTRAIASIGGAGLHDAFAAAAAPGTRATFVANLVQLATDFGFDGFDLDWEPVLAADEADLAALATELRAAAPAIELTIPVGYINANAPDDLSFYASVAPLFDQLNIMSYGMAGPWGGWKSWHSSALFHQDAATPTSLDSTVQAYLAAGAPAAKLGVGVGFYGLCYTPPVAAPLEDLGGSTVSASDGAMSYAHIVEDYATPQAQQWDGAAHVPYLSFGAATGPAGCGYVSYEDAQSIADKGGYVADHGLGGAIVWTINQGYLASAPNGEPNPLLVALRDSILVR